MTEFIRKCIEDVVRTVAIRLGSICAKLKARTTTFNHGKVTRNVNVYKQTSYDPL